MLYTRNLLNEVYYSCLKRHLCLLNIPLRVLSRGSNYLLQQKHVACSEFNSAGWQKVVFNPLESY